MANVSGGARAICPFYLRETNTTITCEGVLEGTQSTIIFQSSEEKQQHQQERCNMHSYKDCAAAKALLDKYE